MRWIILAVAIAAAGCQLDPGPDVPAELRTTVVGVDSTVIEFREDGELVDTFERLVLDYVVHPVPGVLYTGTVSGFGDVQVWIDDELWWEETILIAGGYGRRW